MQYDPKKKKRKQRTKRSIDVRPNRLLRSHVSPQRSHNVTVGAQSEKVLRLGRKIAGRVLLAHDESPQYRKPALCLNNGQMAYSHYKLQHCHLQAYQVSEKLFIKLWNSSIISRRLKRM